MFVDSFFLMAEWVEFLEFGWDILVRRGFDLVEGFILYEYLLDLFYEVVFDGITLGIIELYATRVHGDEGLNHRE